MKDKRQRMAIAWPYAAVYTDPAFAASILHAAASSLPMHYPPPPPIYTHHYPRYHHYHNMGMPPTSIPLSNVGLGIQQTVGLNTTIPPTMTQSQIPQSLNLNLNLDFPSTYHNSQHTKISPNSPVHSDISLSPPVRDSLLIPAARISPQTTVSEKPKLFKPYKSEV